MSINWALIKSEIIDKIYKHDCQLQLDDLYKLTGFSDYLVKQAVEYLIEDRIIFPQNHGELGMTDKGNKMVKEAILKSGACG